MQETWFHQYPGITLQPDKGKRRAGGEIPVGKAQVQRVENRKHHQQRDEDDCRKRKQNLQVPFGKAGFAHGVPSVRKFWWAILTWQVRRLPR